MSLTIKMRIDENPEHSYIFSTGDGGQIELIPLSVVQNGRYEAEEGKAFNLVTVNVPETMLETLNITENGTFTSDSGHAWNVVNVNVEVSNQFYGWICGLRKNAKLVSPPEVVEGFRIFLKEIQERYQDDESLNS